jgi:hypothetical protein
VIRASNTAADDLAAVQRAATVTAHIGQAVERAVSGAEEHEISAQHTGAVGLIFDLVAGGGDIPVVDEHFGSFPGGGPDNHRTIIILL